MGKYNFKPFRAGPAANSKAATEIRNVIGHMVVEHSDYYDYACDSGGHTLTLVVQPPMVQHSWNYRLPKKGQKIAHQDGVIVTMTCREDGLVQIQARYAGSDWALGKLRGVMRRFVPVQTAPESGFFEAHVVPLRFWKTQPWQRHAADSVAVA